MDNNIIEKKELKFIQILYNKMIFVLNMSVQIIIKSNYVCMDKFSN